MNKSATMVLALCGALVIGAPLPALAEGGEIEIQFAKGVYEDLDSNLAPIRQGGIVIRVSSPKHRVTVHGNQLFMTQAGDGAVDATLDVEFEGKGRLVADVENIGRFVDDVAAKRQTVRAAGRVRLAKVDDDYRFTVIEAEPFVMLEIQTGLAGQMVTTCRSLALLPFFNLPCDGLEKSLTHIRVPLPKAGEQFDVEGGLLTAAEKAFLDRFVSR